MQLKDCVTASQSASCSTPGERAASVSTKASIVAIFGAIIPAPLAIPAMVISLPYISHRTDAFFGTVSVVIIASEASSHPSTSSCGTIFRIPVSRHSIGKGTPMTPVELTSASSGIIPNPLPTHCAICRASAIP